VTITSPEKNDLRLESAMVLFIEAKLAARISRCAGPSVGAGAPRREGGSENLNGSRSIFKAPTVGMLDRRDPAQERSRRTLLE